MFTSSRNLQRLVLILAGFGSAGISASFVVGKVFWLSLWVPGVIFSAAVLLPWARAWALPRWKYLVVALLGMAGYEAAAFIVYPTRFFLAPLGGFVGTSIAMLLCLLDGRRALRRGALILIAAGTVLGCVFFAALSLNIAGVMLGIATWQAGMAILMAMLLPVATRAKRAN